MGQLKKIKELMSSYENLPDNDFKESIKDDMEQIKEAYAEVHSLKKMKDKLDDKYCKGCGELSPVCYCDYHMDQTHSKDDCMITYAKEEKDDTHTNG